MAASGGDRGLPAAHLRHVPSHRSGLVAQRHRRGDAQRGRRGRRLALGCPALSVRPFRLLVGRAVRLRRGLGLPQARRHFAHRSPAALGGAGGLRAASGFQRRAGAPAAAHACGGAAARPRRAGRRCRRRVCRQGRWVHGRHAGPADRRRDRLQPVYRHFLDQGRRAGRAGARGGVWPCAAGLGEPARPQVGRAGARGARFRGRDREAPRGGPPAAAHRATGGGDQEIRARAEGEAGAAVRPSPRHAAAAAQAARRGHGRHRAGDAGDAGVHFAPHREEAFGLRRRGQSARRLPRTGHHALRNRAGGRRQGQPDREPGEGPGAGAVGGVDPGGGNHSRQVLHGAGDPQSAPRDGAAIRDPRLRGLPR